jgi:hypothetical protein
MTTRVSPGWGVVGLVDALRLKTEWVAAAYSRHTAALAQLVWISELWKCPSMELYCGTNFDCVCPLRQIDAVKAFLRMNSSL